MALSELTWFMSLDIITKTILQTAGVKKTSKQAVNIHSRRSPFLHLDIAFLRVSTPEFTANFSV